MITIINGECVSVMRTMDADTIDAVITDPPYHLSSIVKRFGPDDAKPARSNGATGVYKRASAGFMGKKWDGGDVAFDPATWREVWRVMKPGAHLVAFGGTRTFHRMVVAIEDAGFEVRDRFRFECEATDKYGPLLDSLDPDQLAGVLQMLHDASGGNELAWTYGSGFPKSRDIGNGWGTAYKPAHEPILIARKPFDGSVAANVEQWGTGAINIDAGRIHAPDATGRTYQAKRLKPGASQGDGSWLQSDVIYQGQSKPGRHPANIVTDGSGFGFPDAPGQPSAARFFYAAKATRDDRAGSKHPTVKPVTLLQWLVRLHVPIGGTILDPFAGSGTTLEAARREGFDAIGIDAEPEYFTDMRRRFNHRWKIGDMTACGRIDDLIGDRALVGGMWYSLDPDNLFGDV